MKQTLPSKKHLYKSISSHALVAAICTQPYLMYLLADIYKLTFNDTSEVVLNNSLLTTMSTLSLAALVISVVSFGLYLNKKHQQ